MEVITYETLYELLRKEKYNQEIQEIDKEFFKKVITYLEEKERLITNSTDSTFSKEIEITKKQMENAKKIIKELYERRENKIIQLALLSSRAKKQDISSLLPEEQKFYIDIYSTTTKYRDEVLGNVLKSKAPEIKEIVPKTIKTDKMDSPNKLIRFLHPTPSFVAPNLKVYGPFDREDISNIPKKAANLLIKKNKAEEIKIEKK